MINASAVGARNGRSRQQFASRCAVLLAIVAYVSELAVGGNPVSAAPNSLPLRATYNASAYVRWSKSILLVSSTAVVSNVTKESVSRLAFNLVPLETGDAKVTHVSVGGKRALARTSAQTVVVKLPKPLRPGQRMKVTIAYRAHFNATTGSRRPLLIKKDNIITAYRWIPWLSREQGFGAPNFGETWITGVSSHVTVNLRSDVKLKFATTGRQTRSTRHGRSQTFSANSVRDFNFAASPDYTVTKTKWRDVDVRLYTRTENVNVLKKWTLAALERYSNEIGPYPYKQLSVAEMPAGSGMESPQMTWISSTVSPSDIRYLAVHEVAHQWFYGVVGDNQQLEPFLDEGVADFLARDLLDAFRKSRCAEDRLDGSVYDYDAQCYDEVIYVQGAAYLDAYRDKVGNRDFWKGLRRFYRDRSFKIAGIRGLLDALDKASGFKSKRHAHRFPSLYP